MNPVYFDELTFNDQKKIVLRFSQEKETKKICFKKNTDYFITSFTCFIKLDITKRKNYIKIEELLRICITISSSSIDEGFDLGKLFFRTEQKGFNDDEWEIEIDKKKRNLHTEKYKFYNTTDNRVREVEVLIPYKQLETEGFTFLNSKPNDIPKS